MSNLGYEHQTSNFTHWRSTIEPPRYRYQLRISFSNFSVTSPRSHIIVQPFRRFTYVTAHSPSLPLLHLRHSSFSNRSFASPTSQALHLRHLASRPWLTSEEIGSPDVGSYLCKGQSSFSKLSGHITYVTAHSQLFSSFTYVTTHSPTPPLLHLRHSSFSNPCFASPTSQALHLRYLASRLWWKFVYSDVII